ncbi:flagellar type III secretion system protein FlhB [Yoonia sp. SS1-5]|uniref:Flagellar type III secretion system protein FlhB n=1 Tax=Yoonia rhodophyticola TaxID=3137370 RepID=A0AAN0MKZ1_9RHOB
MSGQDDDSDKQYEPTQKKLQDARKKGEIAKSTDLTTAAVYLGFLITMMTIGPLALIDLATAMSSLLRNADDLAVLWFSGSGMSLSGGIFSEVSWGFAPWFVIPAMLAIASIILQQSFIVTGSKLAPKLDRISPLSGIKNKFGRQGLFEFFKSTIKLIIYGVIMALFLNAQLDKMIGSMQLPPAVIVAELGRILVQLMLIVLVVAAVLGGIDYLWQRAEHIRKNRMSRKEMMEEHKQAEGDPMMKQQRRQRAHEIAMNKMLADVPTADVIIVNPTHFSVALKWDRSAGGAPICVAKGVDEIAARIREMAHEHAVPIHSDPPTARALHASVEIGEEIAPDHYRAVAAAIRFAESIKQKARRS